MKNDTNDYIDLGKNLITCELCNYAYAPDIFSIHLSKHTRDEVILLKKLAEKTIKMTNEDYKDFLRKLEFVSYQIVLRNSNQKKRIGTKSMS